MGEEGKRFSKKKKKKGRRRRRTKRGGGREKEDVKKKGCIKRKKKGQVGQVGNNKKSERKYYFNKKVCIIDKLMWVFCKSDSVKQKKQIFCIKQMESFAQTNVIALKTSILSGTYCIQLTNLLTNFTFLVFQQIYDKFSTSRNKCSN